MQMQKNEAQKRARKLRKIINDYRYRYHVLDDPTVADETYDSFIHELEKIEAQFPELLTSDSPTQRVGGKPLDKFQKVEHQKPMLSLQDVFTFDELGEWEKRNQKIVKANYEYFAELKMDGLAVSLIYENGIFVRGATRGDGKVGEDVTGNLKTIENIPLRIDTTNYSLSEPPVGGESRSSIPSRLEIRGEIYMSKKVFDELNSDLRVKNLPPFANPRNAAAGSIRQLDPKISASRHLSFVAWDLIGLDGQKHSDVHEHLENLGFPVLKENRICRDLADIEQFKVEIGSKREKLPYQIDGIVAVVNNNDICHNLGVVGKAPRGMIAYKFAPEEAITIVEDIRVQVGRTGILTPVAVLKPVLVDGSLVSRATLHNEDEIGKKDIRIGDTVVVRKAGDVIPEVKSVIKELRTGKEKKFSFPTRCPECEGEVRREAGKAAYRCLNKNCFDIVRRRIGHFVSRSAFDIAGLGPKIINKFLDEGLIKDAADLFNLKKGDIEPLERFADKSAQNIIDSINSHKKIEFPRVIYALGIGNVGAETAYDLAQRFQNLQNLQKATLEEIDSIRDIGSVVAQSIYEYFQDKHNQALINKLLEAGVTIESFQSSAIGNKLAGQTFVLTGALETLTRDEAKAKIRALGGEISSSVSRSTNFVVVGSDPGDKLSQAQKLGVRILNEQEFINMIS